MSILIGGDTVPTKKDIHLFQTGDVSLLLSFDLWKIWESVDFRIVNLEVPLTDESSPIVKSGPNLIAPSSTIVGYKNLDINLVTIANNHILDQNEKGVLSTCDLLEKNGIAYIGAGANLKEASEPYCFYCAGKKVGVYACAEHEFSIATEDSAGANPFDPLESFDHVHKLKMQCDYVIVLYHGGRELYRFPSPDIQKICRKFIDMGADLIVCQHSHCIGCAEEYHDGIIVYGQGNFIFDYNNNEMWQTGLLIKIDDSFNVSYIPIEKNNIGVRLANKERRDQIIASFRERTKIIKQKTVIEGNYSAFAEKMLDEYLISISGYTKNMVFRIVNKITRHQFGKILMEARYKKRSLLALSNYIKCEAHRELLLRGINERLEKYNK